jgi:hypothetical protein
VIHELGVEIGAILASKGLGIPVVDGPERRPTTTFSRERIVIERDGEDGFISRHRTNVNPHAVMTRVIACKITIYAQQPSKGAAEFEHYRRAEQMLDLVLCAIEVRAKTRQNIWLPKSGKFVIPPDMKEGETMGGAIYEFKFTFDRGVEDRKWDGSFPAEASVTSGFIQSSTLVDATETACGA